MNAYERIAALIRYLDTHRGDQPDLDTIAAQVGLSRFHVHRLFAEWAGVTPKDFLQCLTVEHAKARLREGESVLRAALDAGLSGPSRLHDLCVSLEAATPGEIKAQGDGLTITAGFADTPFGASLVASTPRGVCRLAFVDDSSRRTAEAELREDWPRARIEWSDDAAAKVVGPVFAWDGQTRGAGPLRAYVRGSDFQVRVWRALLRIEPGTLVSYGALAGALGHASAARAVGSAVAKNSIAVLIPCHRVIRETGVLGEYRWGKERKRALLAWETAPRGAPTEVLR